MKKRLLTVFSTGIALSLLFSPIIASADLGEAGYYISLNNGSGGEVFQSGTTNDSLYVMAPSNGPSDLVGSINLNPTPSSYSSASGGVSLLDNSIAKSFTSLYYDFKITSSQNVDIQISVKSAINLWNGFADDIAVDHDLKTSSSLASITISDMFSNLTNHYAQLNSGLTKAYINSDFIASPVFTNYNTSLYTIDNEIDAYAEYNSSDSGGSFEQEYNDIINVKTNTVYTVGLTTYAISVFAVSAAFADPYITIMGDPADYKIVLSNGAGNGSPPAPVPEPATMLLFGSGIAGLAVAGRRKRN